MTPYCDGRNWKLLSKLSDRILHNIGEQKSFVNMFSPKHPLLVPFLQGLKESCLRREYSTLIPWYWNKICVLFLRLGFFKPSLLSTNSVLYFKLNLTLNWEVGICILFWKRNYTFESAKWKLIIVGIDEIKVTQILKNPGLENFEDFGRAMSSGFFFTAGGTSKKVFVIAASLCNLCILWSYIHICIYPTIESSFKVQKSVYKASLCVPHVWWFQTLHFYCFSL